MYDLDTLACVRGCGGELIEGIAKLTELFTLVYMPILIEVTLYARAEHYLEW